MKIQIINLQKKVTVNSRRLVSNARKILKHEKIKEATLSFVFVSDQKIRVLNKRFLNEDHATDVLSFEMNLTPNEKIKRRDKLTSSLQGEIIISVDTAVKNAKIYRTPLSQELSLYMIHGMLHLLGYDDHRKSDIALMRKKEQELLNLFTPGE